MPDDFLYDSKKLEILNNELITRQSRAQLLNQDAEEAKKNPELVNGFIKGDSEMQIDSFVEPPQDQVMANAQSQPLGVIVEEEE